jgi:hypothetical protein
MVIRKVSISTEGGVPWIMGVGDILQLRKRNFDIRYVVT